MKNNLKIAMVAVMFGFLFGCSEQPEVSTIFQLDGFSVIDVPELMVVSEKIGSVTIPINLSAEQITDAQFMVTIDQVNSTAVNGVDFDFDDSLIIELPAYLRFSQFTVDIIDNPARDKGNAVAFNIGPAPGTEITASNVASTVIQITNFSSDAITIAHDWATNTNFSWNIENHVKSGQNDTLLFATGLNADNNVTGFIIPFEVDVVVDQNFDTSYVYQTELVEEDACNVDFDVYIFSETTGTALWNNCPEEASLLEDAANGGYLINDDSAPGDVLLPYGIYTAVLDLWSNGYSINDPELLGDEFAGFAVIDIARDYPTDFIVDITAFREGHYETTARVNAGHFNIGDTGDGFLGGLSDPADQPIYTLDLQPGVITINYLNGDNILVGERQATTQRAERENNSQAFDLSSAGLSLD